jgi:hypothetical protein
VPAPQALPEPPPVAEPANPLGTLLPTVALLRDVGIPLAVFGVFGTLLGIVLRGAVKQVRRPRP